MCLDACRHLYGLYSPLMLRVAVVSECAAYGRTRSQPRLMKEIEDQEMVRRM